MLWEKAQRVQLPIELSLLDAGHIGLIGLCAGLLGGLVGLGGSVLMIPWLTVAFASRPWGDQHLFQAASMVVNLAVAVPSTLRHHRARAVDWRAVRGILPWAVGAILAGVLVSDVLPGSTLRRGFAIFLVYVVLLTVYEMVRRRPDPPADAARDTVATRATVGLGMGFFAGLFGVGGGAVAVPLVRYVCTRGLRASIAISSAVMIVTSIPGAITKLSTLGQHGRTWGEGLVLAALLVPGAVIAAYVGAALTHKLPLNIIRGVFAALLAAAAWRMLVQ